MTAFELAIVLLGVLACFILYVAGQNLGKIWMAHSERQRLTQDKMLIELIHLGDRLKAIEESLRNLDR